MHFDAYNIGCSLAPYQKERLIPPWWGLIKLIIFCCLCTHILVYWYFYYCVWNRCFFNFFNDGGIDLLQSNFKCVFILRAPHLKFESWRYILTEYSLISSINHSIFHWNIFNSVCQGHSLSANPPFYVGFNSATKNVIYCLSTPHEDSSRLLSLFDMLLDSPCHESLQDIRTILHLPLEGHYQQGCNVAKVLGGQGPLLLQHTYEDHQERLVGEELPELPKTLLYKVLPHTSNLNIK